MEGAGFSQATSLTKGDYKTPVSVDSVISQERYKNGGKVLDYPTGVPYQSLVGMDGSSRTFQSINQADYIIRNGRGQVFRDARAIGKSNQLDDVSCHFFLESSDNADADHKISITKNSFTNPASSLVNNKNVPCAGANHDDKSVSRVMDGFDVTIENTVTRYPYNKDTYSTTFSSNFKPPTDFTRRQPYEPSKINQLTGHLHPQLTAHEGPNGLEFKHIRELSTVSRRAYIAPEVMKERLQ